MKLERRNSRTPQVRLVDLYTQQFKLFFLPLLCFLVSKTSDEVASPPEELCKLLALNTANQEAKGRDEKNETVEQQTTATPSVSYPTNRLKIHSRKFRE